MENDDVLHDFVDRSIRELLSKPHNLDEFLQSVAPEFASQFDVANMKPPSKDFLVANWRKRTPDLMFEMPFRVDPERHAMVCLLIEHQSGAQWKIPFRTLHYASSYWMWQVQEWEALPQPKARLVMTPVLPIVLYTGERQWNTARTLRDLFGEPNAMHAFVPDWKPLFWELPDHPADELLGSQLVFVRLLALLKATNYPETEAMAIFEQVFRSIDPFFEKGRHRWTEILQYLIGWAYHRRPQSEKDDWRGLAVRLQADSDRRREVEHMGQTIAQSIYKEGQEEGVRLGEEKGLQKGLQKGRHEGELSHARMALLRRARRKLGDPDPSFDRIINEIVDVDRLDRIADRVNDCGSWSDLLDTP